MRIITSAGYSPPECLPNQSCDLLSEVSSKLIEHRAWYFIQLTPKGRAVVIGLLADRESDTGKLTKLAA